MEKILILTVNVLVFISRFIRLGSRWKEGAPLKILLVGYNGARNTGADARVAEMVKQFQEVLKNREHKITVLALKPDNIRLYFDENVIIKKVGITFLKDLFIQTHRSHLVVLCEGSTLKSQFSDMLTLAFSLSAGIMKSLKRPCIAYGSEAGYMSPQIYKAARNLCSDTYFIARTEDSLKIIHEMGLKGHLGTDTAWTLTPPESCKQIVHDQLEKQGWDGHKKILGICAINPFWWPVKPEPLRFATSFLKNDPLRYKFWMYHQFNADDKRKMDHYLTSIAQAINKYNKDQNYFVVLVGMEALDIHAIKALKTMIKGEAALFNSSEYDAYFLTTLLNEMSLLVTSRYHARVLSLASGVPAVAISMDERLKNIYNELKMNQYYLSTDDSQLQNKLYKAIENITSESETVKSNLRERFPYYLRRFDEMGEFFSQHISDKF